MAILTLYTENMSVTMQKVVCRFNELVYHSVKQYASQWPNGI